MHGDHPHHPVQISHIHITHQNLTPTLGHGEIENRLKLGIFELTAQSLWVRIKLDVDTAKIAAISN